MKLLDNTQNETSKFRTRNCIEKNYESRGKYNEPNQVKFKISMLIPFKWT